MSRISDWLSAELGASRTSRASQTLAEERLRILGRNLITAALVFACALFVRHVLFLAVPAIMLALCLLPGVLAPSFRPWIVEIVRSKLEFYVVVVIITNEVLTWLQHVTSSTLGALFGVSTGANTRSLIEELLAVVLFMGAVIIPVFAVKQVWTEFHSLKSRNDPRRMIQQINRLGGGGGQWPSI